MLYTQVINNNDQDWESFRQDKKAANATVDHRNNIALNQNDRIDSLADNVMNMNMNSMFSMRIDNYRSRIGVYKVMAKYPEINKAISSHVNELLVQDDDGNFIDFKFTDLGNVNIPENIKTEIDNIATSIFKTCYSIPKLKRDLTLYYIEGLLAYELVKDSNDNLRLRKLVNGTYYTFTWNDEVKYFIEITNLENLNDEDLDKLRVDTTNLIENAMQQKMNFQQIPFSDIVKVHPADKILYMRWYENEDEETDNTISFLENVAPLYNRLATVEAHLVGYRVSRSLTSYSINLDLGDMPYQDKVAELQNYMDDYDTETVYDTISETTTSIKDVQTINRIFWFTKGGEYNQSTVEPLDFQANFDQIGDVTYIEKKLVHMLKYPMYKWKGVGVVEGDSSPSKSTAIEQGGMLYEEVEYQKFLDNTRHHFVDGVVIPLIQAILHFNGVKPKIYSSSNFNIKLNEDSKYKLYLKKIEIDTRLDLFNSLKGIESIDNLYKEILGKTQAQFVQLIKDKLEIRENGLDKLFEGDDITDEQVEMIKKKYIVGDENFKNKTFRENNTYDNIDARYTKKENKLKLIAMINYFKNIVRVSRIEDHDLYRNANNSITDGVEA